MIVRVLEDDSDMHAQLVVCNFVAREITSSSYLQCLTFLQNKVTVLWCKIVLVTGYRVGTIKISCYSSANLGFLKRGFCSAEECKLSSARNWEQKKVLNFYNLFFLSLQLSFTYFYGNIWRFFSIFSRIYLFITPQPKGGFLKTKCL